ncbi:MULTISPECIES: hypothetical protein [Enterobacteriaceae]|jgi:hypothetical protein|uniref:hypothetical protein n=1 Tax=Enterobacteriaceae TaxID=543 RepID=UPI00064A7D54|nr:MULTISPECIES: hypothetical protein [Enterobacteriaceae]AVE71876.1 hypothetical protein AM439_05305 [Enterobacter cloacae complex sp.]MBJ9516352.1 hypothetical protein [Citrobacter freundii]MDU4337696.1 hypothetical protein [Streptococcus mitis]QLV84214.1 hypothetical protein HV263_18285 [Enterobacter cloacae]HCJ7633676.1 hypothetical protein [Enterobacter hormaechei subsp. xiangfangensis]HDR2159838.1 hypothetical protein [Enterobacter cancerogenus]HED3865224.1 hypothetical protein [Entero
MQFGTFQTLNGDNSHARYKVIAYASDLILQDKLIRVESGIPADLIVGDLVSTSGTKAVTPGDIAYVVVEPASAGDKAFIVASPEHTILSLSGIEFGSLDKSLAQAQLATLGFTFTDFDTVALRTT